MTDVALLGPQYRAPNLKDCLDRLGIVGPLVAITAGWQEREGELDELRTHVGQPVADLALYARAEAVQAADPELAAAMRERQHDLQELQELYRTRLAALMLALTELAAETQVSSARRRAWLAALVDVRRLDRSHLVSTARVHASFRRRWQPHARPSVVAQVADIEHALDGAGAVLIAGGHVAVLMNRLRLFGCETLLRGKTLIGWSAGAMALSERIVLFHDRPPQGAAHAEVLEAGLGLVSGVVALPHAHVRLALEDAPRMRDFARRFAPARCLTLEHGAALHWHAGALASALEVSQITRTGRVTGLEP